jgi:short subunit dehydrogenase-like uncharacterized protein
MSGQEAKPREFDVVIWGASGFTGRLVVEYMHQTYGVDGEVRWAVAGRNENKLKQVLKEMVGPADVGEIPVIVADSNDDASLRAMVASTRAICTTVGPYAMYGTLLVALCAELGTHCCDLTGEVQWMRKMIDLYHPVAEGSGARIVHTCGFDSIPSDLGTLYVQQEMKKRHGVYSPRVKYRVVRADGGMSGGTVASMMNMMEEAKIDPSILDLMADPYALNPANMPRGEDGPDQTGSVYDQDFDQWTAPFIMSGINTRVVRRSHALLDYPWAKNFRYDEAMLMGDGPGGFAKATLVSGGTGLMTLATSFAATRNVLGRLAPSPGEGPSRQTIENGFFEIEFFASHPEDPDKNLVAVVTADRDPGYGATSKMIAESAVCLAKDDLETPAGVLTPAVAMGGALIERLVARAGMTFTIKE